jgi:phosphatidylcholine synthase
LNFKLRTCVAWLVHAYTASGLVFGLLATRAVIDYNYRAAFFWLWLQVVVDATDGALARAARVSERIPWFDGAKLDDIVDYLTYVFVPALFVWRAVLVPGEWAIGIAAGMLLASGYGFSRKDAKTADYFFTGFPSYWNVVTFYLLVAGWSSFVNAVILVVFIVLVFVPIRYVYPSRTPILRVFTNVVGSVWSAMMLLMLWQYPDVSRSVFWMSLSYPIYYVVVSLWLQATRSQRPRVVTP